MDCISDQICQKKEEKQTNKKTCRSAQPILKIVLKTTKSTIVPEALFNQRRIASVTKAEQMWQKEKPPPIHLPNMR